PVGLKDIIDTAKIPTENGAALDAGRVPGKDAWIVTRLKRAGAIVMGKTATTELAFLHPAKTRNPVNPAHSPGGSSAGSAAAVAAGMVPLAIGTQAAGSVIRPAAYCGIVGFKPSFGMIPRTGILRQSPSLDTVGVFANEVEGAALIAEALCGFDNADPATSLDPPPRLLEIALSEPPVIPAFAFVRQPGWDKADAETQLAFDEIVVELDAQCEEVALPGAFAEALAAKDRVHLAELARNYFHYAERGRDRLGAQTLKAIDAGNAIPARDYLSALDWPRILAPALEEIFFRFDAILTPAAPGPAPEGLASTGSPIFNSLWSFCGLPAITLPLLLAGNGLPMGVQIVGPRLGDGKLLRTARWLAGRLTGPQGD
ncbi:MAG: amidase, partial [Cucumibacter sp.]